MSLFVLLVFTDITTLEPSFPLESYNCFRPIRHYSSRILRFVYVFSFRHLFFGFKPRFAYVRRGSALGLVETIRSSSRAERVVVNCFNWINKTSLSYKLFSLKISSLYLFVSINFFLVCNINLFPL